MDFRALCKPKVGIKCRKLLFTLKSTLKMSKGIETIRKWEWKLLWPEREFFFSLSCSLFRDQYFIKKNHDIDLNPRDCDVSVLFR